MRSRLSAECTQTSIFLAAISENAIDDGQKNRGFRRVGRVVHYIALDIVEA